MKSERTDILLTMICMLNYLLTASTSVLLLLGSVSYLVKKEDDQTNTPNCTEKCRNNHQYIYFLRFRVSRGQHHLLRVVCFHTIDHHVIYWKKNIFNSKKQSTQNFAHYGWKPTAGSEQQVSRVVLIAKCCVNWLIHHGNRPLKSKYVK